MCTLVLFCGVSEKHPLTIAANRDEVPTRPSREPYQQTDAVFAPQDLRRGGTWIGVNRHGLAVALTNRDRGSERKGWRSRGLLVNDCLNAATRDEAMAAARRLNPQGYSGFHLVAADRSGASLLVNDGDAYVHTELGAGMHVITSFGTARGHHARDVMIRMRMTQSMADDPVALARLLSFHGPGPEDGTCAHGIHLLDACVHACCGNGVAACVAFRSPLRDAALENRTRATVHLTPSPPPSWRAFCCSG